MFTHTLVVLLVIALPLNCFNLNQMDRVSFSQYFVVDFLLIPPDRTALTQSGFWGSMLRNTFSIQSTNYLQHLGQGFVIAPPIISLWCL